MHQSGQADLGCGQTAGTDQARTVGAHLHQLAGEGSVGIEPSVGYRGVSHDGALAETLIGSSRNNLIHRRAPKKSHEAVELTTLEWDKSMQHWMSDRNELGTVWRSRSASRNHICICSHKK